jgi:hypothetical protein
MKMNSSCSSPGSRMMMRRMNGTSRSPVASIGDLPLVLAVVELLRVVHVVDGVEPHLDAVDVARVAEVRAQPLGHLGEWAEDAGKMRAYVRMIGSSASATYACTVPS